MGDLKLYQLDEDYEYKLPKKFQKDIMGPFKFYNKEYNLIMELDGKSVKIKKGYQFIGCSPKVQLFGHVVGTPDGKIDPKTGKPLTFYCSMVHDAMTMNDDEPNMPYTRKEMDDLFKHMLYEVGWKYSKLYWIAVRAFSIITFQDS